MLQFHLQARGVADREPLAGHVAVPGDDPRPGAHLAQRRLGSPSTCRLRSARPFVPTTETWRSPPLATEHDSIRSTDSDATARRRSRSALALASVLRAAAEDRARRRPRRRPRRRGRAGRAARPLKVAFAYVGPVGDAGWTFAHDKARKAVEAEFGAKVATSFVENVPEAADAERVMRDMVGAGQQARSSARRSATWSRCCKVAADAKDVKFEHATGYKTGAQPAHLRLAHLRGRVHGRRHRGRHDQEPTCWAWWRRSRSPRSSATSTPSRWARRA